MNKTIMAIAALTTLAKADFSSFCDNKTDCPAIGFWRPVKNTANIPAGYETSSDYDKYKVLDKIGKDGMVYVSCYDDSEDCYIPLSREASRFGNADLMFNQAYSNPGWKEYTGAVVLSSISNCTDESIVLQWFLAMPDLDYYVWSDWVVCVDEWSPENMCPPMYCIGDDC